MQKKLILLMLPFLFSCANGEMESISDEIPYHSYSEVSNCTIKWQNVFTQAENNYIVYFFSKTCHYCEEARDEVIDIALKKAKPFYFCFEGIQTDLGIIPESTIGIYRIEDFKIKGVPSVVSLQNHQVQLHFAGKKASLNFLRSLS